MSSAMTVVDRRPAVFLCPDLQDSSCCLFFIQQFWGHSCFVNTDYSSIK